MGKQISLMLNSVFVLDLKSNINKKTEDYDIDCIEKNKETFEKVEQKSKQKFVTKKLGSEKYDFHISLDELTDNFAYFKKKRQLLGLKENETVINVCNISKESFKSLMGLLNAG